MLFKQIWIAIYLLHSHQFILLFLYYKQTKFLKENSNLNFDHSNNINIFNSIIRYFPSISEKNQYIYFSNANQVLYKKKKRTKSIEPSGRPYQRHPSKSTSFGVELDSIVDARDIGSKVRFSIVETRAADTITAGT